MKIGFLTSEYPHKLTGSSAGIGSSIKSLALSFKELGNEVTVFIYGQNVDGRFVDEGITIIQIRNKKFKGFSWCLTRKKIQNIINRYVSESGLQIIEAPDWTGITAFTRLRCPVIVKLHGSDTYFCNLEGRPVKRFNYFLEKQALKKADAIISVSSFTANFTNKLFGLNRNFEIIPNGITINESIIYKAAVNDLENSQIILYVGTLIRKKGALEIPLIFNEVSRTNKEAKLMLVGKDSGDIKSGSLSTWELMKLLFTSDALSRVTYIGMKPHNEIDKYYDMASVCIFPSFAEAFPMSWLEAMSHERAVVASDIGWADEVIENGVSGLLCNPMDHKRYAGFILRVLNDKEYGACLGKEAKKRVIREFSSKKIALKTLQFYKSLINE